MELYLIIVIIAFLFFMIPMLWFSIKDDQTNIKKD